MALTLVIDNDPSNPLPEEVSIFLEYSCVVDEMHRDMTYKSPTIRLPPNLITNYQLPVSGHLSEVKYHRAVFELTYGHFHYNYTFSDTERINNSIHKHNQIRISLKEADHRPIVKFNGITSSLEEKGMTPSFPFCCFCWLSSYDRCTQPLNDYMLPSL